MFKIDKRCPHCYFDIGSCLTSVAVVYNDAYPSRRFEGIEEKGIEPVWWWWGEKWTGYEPQPFTQLESSQLENLIDWTSPAPTIPFPDKDGDDEEWPDLVVKYSGLSMETWHELFLMEAARREGNVNYGIPPDQIPDGWWEA